MTQAFLPDNAISGKTASSRRHAHPAPVIQSSAGCARSAARRNHSFTGSALPGQLYRVGPQCPGEDCPPLPPSHTHFSLWPDPAKQSIIRRRTPGPVKTGGAGLCSTPSSMHAAAATAARHALRCGRRRGRAAFQPRRLGGSPPALDGCRDSSENHVPVRARRAAGRARTASPRAQPEPALLPSSCRRRWLGADPRPCRRSCGEPAAAADATDTQRAEAGASPRGLCVFVFIEPTACGLSSVRTSPHSGPRRRLPA